MKKPKIRRKTDAERKQERTHRHIWRQRHLISERGSEEIH